MVRATSRGVYVLTTAPLVYTNTKTTQNGPSIFGISPSGGAMDWEHISALWIGSLFLGGIEKINCLETEIKHLFLEQNRVNKTN